MQDPKLKVHAPLIRQLFAALASGRMQPGTARMSCEDVLLSMPLLRMQLRVRGHHTDAGVLEILGNADMAWDMSGLTQCVRSDRLQRLQRLLLTVLAECMRSAAAMQRSHVAGFPRDLVWVLAQNVSARAQLLAAAPMLAPYVNERALSQDDVELEFSSLVFLAGYKPDLETALSRLTSTNVLAAMRSNPHLAIYLTTSTKSTYTYHERSCQRKGGDDWNDGRRLSEHAQHEEFAGRLRRAIAQLPGAHSSVRSWSSRPAAA
jgi:hypothetical protein